MKFTKHRLEEMKFKAIVPQDLMHLSSDQFSNLLVIRLLLKLSGCGDHLYSLHCRNYSFNYQLNRMLIPYQIVCKLCILYLRYSGSHYSIQMNWNLFADNKI